MKSLPSDAISFGLMAERTKAKLHKQLLFSNKNSKKHHTFNCFH